MGLRIGAIVLLAALGLPGCGSDKMERGLVVDQEDAAPGSTREFEMTEAERQHQIQAEDEKAENADVDRAEEM